MTNEENATDRMMFLVRLADMMEDSINDDLRDLRDDEVGHPDAIVYEFALMMFKRIREHDIHACWWVDVNFHAKAWAGLCEMADAKHNRKDGT